MNRVERRAGFARMDQAEAADWQIIADHFIPFTQGLADRVLTHLKILEGDFGGFPVDRLEHSLQTATRARRAGESDDYIVMALLHDIGDTLGSYNHPDIAAAIMKPFADERLQWIVQHHGIFQGYYFFHHLGLDRDMREQFRGHPHFEDTARFCELYDQASFDRGFDSDPLDSFELLVRRFFAAPQQSVYISAD